MPATLFVGLPLEDGQGMRCYDDNILGVKLCVNTSSEEFKFIERAKHSNEINDTVNYRTLEVILHNLEPVEFVDILDNIRKEAYQQGQSDYAKELHRLLRLDLPCLEED